MPLWDRRLDLLRAASNPIGELAVESGDLPWPRSDHHAKVHIGVAVEITRDEIMRAARINEYSLAIDAFDRFLRLGRLRRARLGRPLRGRLRQSHHLWWLLDLQLWLLVLL